MRLAYVSSSSDAVPRYGPSYQYTPTTRAPRSLSFCPQSQGLPLGLMPATLPQPT